RDRRQRRDVALLLPRRRALETPGFRPAALAFDQGRAGTDCDWRIPSPRSALPPLAACRAALICGLGNTPSLSPVLALRGRSTGVPRLHTARRTTDLPPGFS